MRVMTKQERQERILTLMQRALKRIAEDDPGDIPSETAKEALINVERVLGMAQPDPKAVRPRKIDPNAFNEA